jgi:membrane protein
MNRSAPLRTFFKELYEAWSIHTPARLAAALAYYGMFSFAPMLYVAMMVAGRFIDILAMADQLFVRLTQTLGPEVTQFVHDMVLNASQRTSGGTTLSSLISLGALLYAATGLFAHLKYSLNIIWEVPPEEQGGILGFVLTRLLAFALVLGVGLMFILATFVSFAGSILTTFFGFGNNMLLGNLVGFVGLAALTFAILYKILPDTKVAWRDVWLGALITALAFALGRWGLSFYLSHSSVDSAFEAAGALAIVLIAIYYAAQIFLFGAIFTRVYATQFGSKTARSL